MKRQVKPMIILYNNMHRIINLLIITNVNIIFMIEQHNNLLIELIVEYWNNHYAIIAMIA